MIRGKRGQAFLREMAVALDAMPVKELISGEVVRDEQRVCAIGAVAVARKIDVSVLDIYDGEDVGNAMGIARALACEIAYENDECGRRQEIEGPSRHAWGPETRPESPAERWTRMRRWIESQIVK
jgi:hypothetical protein